MKVKSESEVAQSCPTLSNPMDCSLTGSSVHGIFQARVLESGSQKHRDRKKNCGLQGLEGGAWGLFFNEYRASALQDEESSGDG